MAERVVDVLEAVEVEEEDGEELVVVAARAAQGELEVVTQERAVRQARQAVVEGRVAEVIFARLQLGARALKLGDVARQLLDVALGLFGALALGGLGLRGRPLDVFQILVVGEVDDRDDGDGDQERVDADGVAEADDEAGDERADEVGDRTPKVVARPSLPEGLAGLERVRHRNDGRVRGVLREGHRADEREHGRVGQRRGRPLHVAEDEADDVRRQENRARRRADVKEDGQRTLAGAQARARALDGREDDGLFGAVEQKRQEDEGVGDRDVGAGARNLDGEARADDGGEKKDEQEARAEVGDRNVGRREDDQRHTEDDDRNLVKLG